MVEHHDVTARAGIRQVARRLKDGRLELVSVPRPAVAAGTVAVRVEASVISAGTERATLEVARKGMIGKARARPDQARQVVDRMRRDGVRSTLEVVRQRLEELGPLGYSGAGRVIEVGPGVRDLCPGDRVAIAGAGSANHAEIDVVPALLCARVPGGVRPDAAAFATLGAIAMHGFRQSGADLGSSVAVIGLGVIGQLAVRIARAAGCRVLATDLDPALVERAADAGAVPFGSDTSAQYDGCLDTVLICASSATNAPIELAARLARDRAVVVVIGDTKMDIPRASFYEKELELRLSRSYGPGRYDREYERWGLDYPIGYVRWTQQRNMASFLELVAQGLLDPVQLVTHRFRFDDAEAAFAALEQERPLIGVVLEYGDYPAPQRTPRRRHGTRSGRPRFGLIGTGNFATATIIPGLVEAGLEPVVAASASGLSAESARRRFGFEVTAADPAEVIERDDLDLVVVATRHDSHATLVAASLAAGRATYVEKPLAFDPEGLAQVRDALARGDAPLFVGFNRRFAPQAVALRERMGSPRLMTFRVNAGRLSRGHWLNDPREGGGRLIGEGCHFIDFLCNQVTADPESVVADGYPSVPDLPVAALDNFSVQVRFRDGSVGNVVYSADAPTAGGKERFEVAAPGGSGYIDDFKGGAYWSGTRKESLGQHRQDKGFAAQFAALAAVLRGERPAPDPESYLLTTLATLAAARALETGTREVVVETVAAEAAPSPVSSELRTAPDAARARGHSPGSD